MSGISGNPSGGGLSQSGADARYIQKDGSTATTASIPLTKGVTIGSVADQGLIRIYDASFVPMFWRVTASPSLINRTLLLNFAAWTTGHTLTFDDVDGTVTQLGNSTTGSGNIVQATSPTLTTPVLTTPTENGVKTAVAAKTADYTLTATDGTITVDATAGNVTITLPAASASVGQLYRIKRIDASGNTVTIARVGADTIDGATSVALTTQWQAKTIQCLTTAAWGVF